MYCLSPSFLKFYFLFFSSSPKILFSLLRDNAWIWWKKANLLCWRAWWTASRAKWEQTAKQHRERSCSSPWSVGAVVFPLQVRGGGALWHWPVLPLAASHPLLQPLHFCLARGCWGSVLAAGRALRRSLQTLQTVPVHCSLLWRFLCPPALWLSGQGSSCRPWLIFVANISFSFQENAELCWVQQSWCLQLREITFLWVWVCLCSFDKPHLPWGRKEQQGWKAVESQCAD